MPNLAELEIQLPEEIIMDEAALKCNGIAEPDGTQNLQSVQTCSLERRTTIKSHLILNDE